MNYWEKKDKNSKKSQTHFPNFHIYDKDTVNSDSYWFMHDIKWKVHKKNFSRYSPNLYCFD